jgi:hypothetical protein
MKGLLGYLGRLDQLLSQVILRLNTWLLEPYRAGETAALIVDEAQNPRRRMYGSLLLPKLRAGIYSGEVN